MGRTLGSTRDRSGNALGVRAGALALAVVPGPAVLYIVAQSINGGRRAGLAVCSASPPVALVHVLAAVVGLSALLVSSAEAFTVVKLVGAPYLILLGIRTLLVADDRIGGRRPEPTLRRTYRQGVVVNVLNPKTALFFLAFLPQFVDPDGSAAHRSSCSGHLRRHRPEQRPAVGARRRHGSRRCCGRAAPSCARSATSRARSSSASALSQPSRDATARNLGAPYPEAPACSRDG